PVGLETSQELRGGRVGATISMRRKRWYGRTSAIGCRPCRHGPGAPGAAAAHPATPSTSAPTQSPTATIRHPKEPSSAHPYIAATQRSEAYSVPSPFRPQRSLHGRGVANLSLPLALPQTD